MKNHDNRKLLCALVALLVVVGVTACATAPKQSSASAAPESSTSSEALPESSTPEQSSESAASVIAPQSTASTAAPPAPETLTQPKAVKLSTLYSWNPADYTYHTIGIGSKLGKNLFPRLQAYQPDPTAIKEENPTEKLGFLALMSDGSKHNYYVTATQLSSKEDGVLKASAAECEELLQLARTNNAEKIGVPQWLGYMSLQRITSVEFSGMNTATRESLDFSTSDEKDIQAIGATLRRLWVNPNATEKISGDIAPTTSDGLMTVRLHFDSGVVYEVTISDSFLGVQSSDMPDRLGYTLTPELVKNDPLRTAAERIHCRLTGKALPSTNPDTGKPVIYLYPQKPTEVFVNLRFGGELWYTFPTLGNGWNVTAYPDGRLINKADGSEHYYLFWEGSSGTDWSFDEGFCVAGADTQQFLLEKLPFLGLTPREYNDFITYWVPKMQDNPYNLITFAAEQYEQLAPLTISPAPDSILRVHMVYKALQQPQAIPTQTLKPFTRTGFTVVEWGGSRA